MVGASPPLRLRIAAVLTVVVSGPSSNSGQPGSAPRSPAGSCSLELVAAGLALPRPDRSWWTLLPLLAFALSFAAGGLSGSPVQFFSSAILFLALGLNEELLYRGVIQHATNTLGAA